MSHPHPELGSPPALPAGGLRVVPLGGLGEIDRNMTVFEFEGRLLIVDCGVLFPESEQPGVDLILPDFDYIRARLDDIAGIVLTHGHEDHIGGVPYLLRERPDIPLIGSRLTLALLEAKLAEHRIKPPTVQVREGETRGFGPLGADGSDLLLSDSTNAEVPGFVTSERDIGIVLSDVLRTAEKRAIVACFASHVHRVQQVLDAAYESGRKVCFVGRSMVRNMGVARDLGYLRVPAGILVDQKEMDDLPGEQIVLVCTGSQGEPMSALSRMANRDHQIRIEQGDTVILASSLIPGNENADNREINGLTRWGARVVHKDNAQVHDSGHAPAGEQQKELTKTLPGFFMPVH